MMPEMDGMETFHRAMLMRDSLCGRSTYIVMTANAVMGAREMYLAEGFKDYISKPVQPEVLEDILMRYIPEDKLVDPTVCDEDRESPTMGAGTVDDTAGVMENRIQTHPGKKFTLTTRKVLHTAGAVKTF